MAHYHLYRYICVTCGFEYEAIADTLDLKDCPACLAPNYPDSVSDDFF